MGIYYLYCIKQSTLGLMSLKVGVIRFRQNILLEYDLVLASILKLNLYYGDP